MAANEPSDSPVPYRVAYSEWVRRELRQLLLRAVAQGFGRQALDAVKISDARLRIYPQFGEPLRDLKSEGATLWIGVVAPLVIQYIIDETNHAVFVVRPHRLLPGTGPSHALPSPG